MRKFNIFSKVGFRFGVRNKGSATPSSHSSILHVGNIAHNAYYNARAVERDGYESDILCHDYYHYAACPEWLALGTEGVSLSDLGNDFFPNFFQFASAHAMRPRSFCQGPTHIAVNYLWLRRTGQTELANVAWNCLQYQRFKSTADHLQVPSHVSWTKQQFYRSLLRLKVAKGFFSELEAGFECEQRALEMLELISKVVRAELKLNSLPMRREYLDYIEQYLTANLKADILARVRDFRESGESVAIGFETFAARYEVNKEEFDGVLPEDIDPYLSQLGAWKEIGKLYDFKIFYSTHPIFAYLSGCRPYGAYEHGTIRTIPMQNDALGRLTRAAYLNSSVCFVTNADYLSADERLPLAHQQTVFIPHGFDDSESVAFYETNSSISPPSDRVVFIAPARHAWLDKTNGNSKGNDLIIRAVHKLHKQGHRNFVVQFVSYGDDINDSKLLIQKLKVSQYFEWLPSQTRPDLWARYMSSHAVLDQFIIPAIGAIGVETLALGRRLINADNGSMAKFFECDSPLMGANNVQELVSRMQDVLNDPLDSKGIGASGREWFMKNHSEAHIRNQFLIGLEKLKSTDIY